MPEDVDRIIVDNLTHRYGSHLALNRLSFSVRSGEIFGLLGPNGGGKTTVFRILSTLLKPTMGRAFISGIDVTQKPGTVRKHIGVVFQSPSIDLKLTVSENLHTAGHLYGLKGKVLQRTVEEMLTRFGLADRANSLAETLSGGLRRRVELAKALIHRPGVLLLDEPSAGLDPGARRDLWNYIESLRESEGVTVVLTTHFMEEGENCDRVGILDRGLIVAIGSPSELKAQIGGDVVSAQSREPEKLRESIRDRFGLEATVLDDAVHIECRRGHEFIAQLVEAFPGRISSVVLRKPTLEDVFIQRTGHRLSQESSR